VICRSSSSISIISRIGIIRKQNKGISSKSEAGVTEAWEPRGRGMRCQLCIRNADLQPQYRDRLTVAAVRSKQHDRTRIKIDAELGICSMTARLS
jgi:hypothetical protein